MIRIIILKRKDFSKIIVTVLNAGVDIMRVDLKENPVRICRLLW